MARKPSLSNIARKPPPPEDGAALGEKLVSSMYRLRPSQQVALRTAAVALQAGRGHGKADASEVLRRIIDAWLADGGGLPPEK